MDLANRKTLEHRLESTCEPVEVFLWISNVRVDEEGTYRLWGDMGWDTEESAR